MPIRFFIFLAISVSLSGCAPDAEKRENYEKRLANFDQANINVAKKFTDTWGKKTCPITLGIKIASNGHVNAIWTRAKWDEEGFEFPCVSIDEPPEVLKEISLAPPKNQLLQIKKSFARLPFRTVLGDGKDGEFALPDGCGVILGGETSRSIWIEKGGGTTGFLIQEGCNSNSVASARLIVDDSIKELLGDH